MFMSRMEAKEDFKSFVGHRLGYICAIADRLDELGYFSAPASLKHHGNNDGGLYCHSKEVTSEMLNLTERLGMRWSRPESPYIVGMFHDVCKVDNYKREIIREECADSGMMVCKIEGKWVYSNDVILPGHGEKSVILTQNIIGKLTEEEIMCIRWHMGAFDERECWKYYTAAVRKYPNVLYTHTADMIAAHITGV